MKPEQKADLQIGRFSRQNSVKYPLEEAYRIINQSPAVIFLWKNEEGWPVEFVSENLSDVFGYSPDEFLSGRLSFGEIIYPEDLALVTKEVTENSREPGTREFVHRPYRIRSQSGEIRWVEDRTSIRRDDQGRITHYQGIMLDITEKTIAQSRLEQALHELNERNKELHCLYSVAHILERQGLDLEDTLLEIVRLISPACQTPEATFARISYRDKTYTTRHFKETSWKQESPIMVKGEQAGKIEIFVQNSLPSSELRPFLPEEQKLLDAIADQISHAVERKDAEDALRENEAHYRNLVENLGEVIFTIDKGGRLTYVSPNIQTLIGHSQSELLGKPFAWVVAENDLAERKTRFAEVLSGRARVSEFRLKTRSGQERWVRASSGPLLKGNQVVGLQGVLVDITDLKQAWKELLESRERLETILISLPVGVVIIDLQTRTIVEANPAALSLIGAPEEAVIGHRCHQYICPAEDGKCPITDLGLHLDNSERTLLDVDGNAIPIQKIVIPIDLDNRPFLIECFSDIRTQKKAQQEKEAKEKLQGVIEMAGAVCHELNQPLQALIGYADLMALDLVPESPLRRHAENIRDQVQSVSLITRKLEGIKNYKTKGYLGKSRIIDIDRASGVEGEDSGTPQSP